MNEIMIRADENNGFIATVNGETRSFHSVAAAGKWADDKLHEQDTAPVAAEFDLGREYKNCPICNALVPWDTMVWLDGLCTCTRCYEKRRKK